MRRYPPEDVQQLRQMHVPNPERPARCRVLFSITDLYQVIATLSTLTSVTDQQTYSCNYRANLAEPVRPGWHALCYCDTGHSYPIDKRKPAHWRVALYDMLQVQRIFLRVGTLTATRPRPGDTTLFSTLRATSIPDAVSFKLLARPDTRPRIRNATKLAPSMAVLP